MSPLARSLRAATLLVLAALVLASCTSPAQQRLGSAEKAAAAERWDEAITVLDEAIELDPTLAESLAERRVRALQARRS